MSVREQLQREASLLPDSTVQRLLDYLHSIPAEACASTGVAPGEDYFDAYWAHWYGRCEGQLWEEPEELAIETREVW